MKTDKKQREFSRSYAEIHGHTCHVDILLKFLDDIDTLEARCEEQGKLIEDWAITADKLQRKNKQQAELLERAKNAIRAKNGLNACYRVGKHPTKKLWDELAKADATLVELENKPKEALND